jgi:hypothetical protein
MLNVEVAVRTTLKITSSIGYITPGVLLNLELEFLTGHPAEH